MKYVFILFAILLSNQILFAEAECVVSDGVITFLYYAEQDKVDDYNLTATTGSMINPYTVPSEFEIMVSTTFSFKTKSDYSDLLKKDVIKEKYFQEWKTKKDLEDAQAANTDLDLSADIDKADKKLKEIKAAHSKAQ